MSTIAKSWVGFFCAAVCVASPMAKPTVTMMPHLSLMNVLMFRV